MHSARTQWHGLELGTLEERANLLGICLGEVGRTSYGGVGEGAQGDMVIGEFSVLDMEDQLR
eukprot:3570313-Amphidinium_carterae.1